jgi:hypothetical protein
MPVVRNINSGAEDITPLVKKVNLIFLAALSLSVALTLTYSVCGLFLKTASKGGSAVIVLPAVPAVNFEKIKALIQSKQLSDREAMWYHKTE